MATSKKIIGLLSILVSCYTVAADLRGGALDFFYGFPPARMHRALSPQPMDVKDDGPSFSESDDTFMLPPTDSVAEASTHSVATTAPQCAAPNSLASALVNTTYVPSQKQPQKERLWAKHKYKPRRVPKSVARRIKKSNAQESSARKSCSLRLYISDDSDSAITITAEKTE